MITAHNIQVTIETKYDSLNNTMRVMDDFGEFIPFPLPMWNHYVEMPWRKHFRFTKTPFHRVIEIFIGHYQHRYIGKN